MIRTQVKLHNRFDFEIYDTETGKTTYAKAENIVLNQLITKMWNHFQQIFVGTGTGTLSPTRTSLFTHLAAQSATLVELVYDTDTTGHVTKKVIFTETQANGVWTEVALAQTSTTTTAVTHALIEDSEGNPITINKTNTKIITVYGTIYAEVLSPPTGLYNISNGSNNAILRLCLGESAADNAWFSLSCVKKIDGSPSILFPVSWVTGSISTIGVTKDQATQRIYTAVKRFAVGEANYPIRGIILHTTDGSMPRIDMSFGALSIPHSTLFQYKEFTSIGIGTGDGTNTEFDFPLDNIMPESEEIFVNGVLKTRNVDYTVHYGLKSTSTMLVDTPDLSSYYSTGTVLMPGSYSETVELPQPPGVFFADGASMITQITTKNGPSTSYFCSTCLFELSEDGVNWIEAGSSSNWTRAGVLTFNSFTPAKYKYLRCSFTEVGTQSRPGVSYIRVHATPPTTQKQIKFSVPPANGHAITSNFKVDYIPKSSNFVLDLQGEIQIGSV